MDDSRVVQGWRARADEDRRKAQREVSGASAVCEYFQDLEAVCALSLRYGDKGTHRVRRFEDQVIASGHLRLLNNKRLRIIWSERTTEQRDLDSIRGVLYWLSLPPAVKKKRIENMVEYNRVYRPLHREEVNEWAREFHAKNRQKHNSLKRVVRAQRTPEEVERVSFQTAVYGQLLALAGLAPWQKKHC
jgi:hypothetical protein